MILKSEMVEGEESRCVLCNQVVAEGCAVSAQCRSSMSHTEILLVLQAILSPPSYPSPPSSTRLCTRCFNLLDTIDTLQVQLKLKKSEVLNLSANCRNDIGNTAKIEHKVLVTEVTEPPKKKDKGLLTSEDLKCQVCDKSFEKRRYLMDHLRRVHNSAVHQCKGCSVRFKLKEELISHQHQCESFLSTKTQPAVSGGISVTSGPRGAEEEARIRAELELRGELKMKSIELELRKRGEEEAVTIREEFEARGAELEETIRKEFEERGAEIMAEVEAELRARGVTLQEEGETACAEMIAMACEVRDIS